MELRESGIDLLGVLAFFRFPLPERIEILLRPPLLSPPLESLRPASGGLGGDDEEGPAAVTMEGTADCVAAPASLFLVSKSLSSDPEESPPMSNSSMRAIVAV